MSIEKTTNYELNKPGYNEFADIADLNSNMDLIDEALAGKADIGDLPDLTGVASEAYVDNRVQTPVPQGAKFTDTVYTHPTSPGNKHVPAGGSEDQILRFKAEGEAEWDDENFTTYNNATTSAAGLMSKSDKIKLNGLPSPENAANKDYVDSKCAALSRRADILEMTLFSNVIGHKFMARLDDLTGINMVNGCWNELLERAEC